MKRTDTDRSQWALGAFLASQDGPDAVRDALDDSMVKHIGQLIQCGDLAAIGPYLARTLAADKGMQSSMAYAEAQERRQMRMELAESDRSSRIASQLGGDIGYVFGALR